MNSSVKLSNEEIENLEKMLKTIPIDKAISLQMLPRDSPFQINVSKYPSEVATIAAPIKMDKPEVKIAVKKPTEVKVQQKPVPKNAPKPKEDLNQWLDSILG